MQQGRKMDNRKLKQKVRELKKLELVLRFGLPYEVVHTKGTSIHATNKPLLWNQFFSLHEKEEIGVRYQLKDLEALTNEELKQVFDEFWFYVYAQIYVEKGISMVTAENSSVLCYLGLPYDADQRMIKKRFRELCKQYHPDAGGNKEQFAELMKMMEKRTN